MRDWLDELIHGVEADGRPVTALMLIGENVGTDEFGRIPRVSLVRNGHWNCI